MKQFNNITIKVLIEIPSGSQVKYEWDDTKKQMIVDHVLPHSLKYPENYGRVEGIKGSDGNNLDAIVLCSQTLSTGAYIETRPIGMIEMKDEHGEDNKLICVPIDDQADPECGKWQDINDIPKKRLKKIENFYSHHKDWEKKGWTKVKGIANKTNTKKWFKTKYIYNKLS